jgi:hypothetical protein
VTPYGAGGAACIGACLGWLLARCRLAAFRKPAAVGAAAAYLAGAAVIALRFGLDEALALPLASTAFLALHRLWLQRLRMETT